VPQTSSSSVAKAATYAIDVFRTALGSDSDGGRTGMLCNTGDTECSGRGTCCHAFTSGSTVTYQVACTNEDYGGCVCATGYSGEFCEIAPTTSGAVRIHKPSLLVVVFATLFTLLTQNNMILK
jgi:hypothetical protein